MRARPAHRVSRPLLAALLVLLLVPTSAFAVTGWVPEIDQFSFRIDPQGHVGSGNVGDICVDGTTVYSVSYTGFTVVDASDPANPRGVSQFVLPYAECIAARGDSVFVGSGPMLFVFDVSDPAQPSLVTSLTVANDESIRDLALVGDDLYAACGYDGVHVVDVSSPSAPVAGASLAVGDEAENLSAEDGRVYVSGWRDSLRTLTVLDASTPASPVERGHCHLLPAAGGMDSMATTDSIVYMPTVGGLSVVDATDPETPFVTKTFDQLAAGNGVIGAAMAANGTLLLADWSYGWSRGLQTWDASQPAVPAKVTSYDDLDQPREVAASGNVAYVADNGGLAIFDVSIAASPALLGRYRSGWNVRTVRTAGDLAYYADDGAGLLVADLTTPTAPVVIGRLHAVPGEGALCADVAGNRGYVGARRTDLDSDDETYALQVAHLTTPTAPVLLASLPSTHAVVAVAYSGGNVVAACNEDTGLRVADVSDPAHPFWTGSLDVGPAVNLTVVGDRAYVVAFGEDSVPRLVVVDISDPDSPVQVGEYRPQARPFDEMPRVRGAYESNGRVYVSVDYYGYVVLDADTLQRVGVCTFMLDGGSVYVEGDTGYVCGDYLQLYDLSDPDEPVLKGFISGFGVLNDLRPAAGGTFATVGPGLFTGEWTPTPAVIERVAGSNRFATSAALSELTSWEWGADTVVLATGRNFPDALAGAPLAYQLGAPLLLVERSSVPASVTAEIKRLGATHAVILGSDAAVDGNVVSQLHSIFGTTSPDVVERIGGEDRYETAAMIAEYVVEIQGDDAPHAAFVATGRNYPDALSVSGLAAVMGYPILLTETAYVPGSTADAMESLDITGTIVLGSDKSVSATVYSQVHGTRRISGPTRYATSAAIADFGVGDAWFERGIGLYPMNVFLATGENYPDAIAAGPGAGNWTSPMLLVRAPLATEPAQAATRSWLEKYRPSIGRVVNGGPATLPDSILDDAEALLAFPSG